MPQQPTREPGRGHSRPGGAPAARATKRRSTLDVPVAVGGGTVKGENAVTHARARRRVISTLAAGATRWIVAVVAVAAILVVSFVSSLSVYFRQQHEIAAARATIATAAAQVTDLQDQMARWQDPAYVQAQARDRLGWVMPGEVGYRVIDADGNVIGGLTPTVASQNAGTAKPWYQTLGESIATADQPSPSEASPAPAAPATVGPDSNPSPR